MNYNQAELCKDCKKPVEKSGFGTEERRRQIVRILENAEHGSGDYKCWDKREFNRLLDLSDGTTIHRELIRGRTRRVITENGKERGCVSRRAIDRALREAEGSWE